MNSKLLSLFQFVLEDRKQITHRNNAIQILTLVNQMFVSLAGLEKAGVEYYQCLKSLGKTHKLLAGDGPTGSAKLQKDKARAALAAALKTSNTAVKVIAETGSPYSNCQQVLSLIRNLPAVKDRLSVSGVITEFRAYEWEDVHKEGSVQALVYGFSQPRVATASADSSSSAASVSAPPEFKLVNGSSASPHCVFTAVYLFLRKRRIAEERPIIFGELVDLACFWAREHRDACAELESTVAGFAVHNQPLEAGSRRHDVDAHGRAIELQAAISMYATQLDMTIETIKAIQPAFVRASASWCPTQLLKCPGDLNAGVHQRLLTAAGGAFGLPSAS